MSAKYAFELSGEHETLPRSEARALLDAHSSEWREVALLDQCLVVEADGLEVEPLGSRLAMTHRIIEVLGICDASEEAVLDLATKMPVPEERYSIRARRIKQSSPSADRVEKAVGTALFRRGYRADLSCPELKLRAIITGDKVVLGIERFVVDRGSFESRRPHLKPFFYPGVLMPRVARALINLSGARPGQVVLDPFSGTGGILVEACLMGISGMGVDVQEKLIDGSKSNLEGLDCCLIAGDARGLPLKSKSIDSAVFDIPYGRSAAIRAKSREELLEKSLSEVHRALKLSGRAVIVADRQIDDLIEASGFKVIERHKDRVHRSLTRQIFVCIPI